MKEIKFRVWNDCFMGFRYYDLNNIITYKEVYSDDLLNGRVFEQSTGLTDKNGKEIYEGDIIERVQIITTVRTVIFHNGCFMGENHKPHPTDKFTKFPIQNGSKWEIVGNIHE